MARSAAYDPVEKFRFVVEMESITGSGFSRAGFLTCSLPTESTTEILYREGQYRDTHEKSMGLVKFSDITLTRGVTKDQDFYNWMQLHKLSASSVRGSDGSFTANDTRPSDEASNNYRRMITITVLDRESKPYKQWKVYNAHIAEFIPGDTLDGNAEEKLITTLTLRHEGFEEIAL
jgi:phage tail-like protein